MFFRLLVPRPHYHAMLKHAKASLPAECCGFLVGEVTDGAGSVCDIVSLTNRLASPTRYEADLAELFAVQKRLRAAGWQELAIYHSHPTSPPVPSRTDLERNSYGTAIVHLIIGLSGPEPEVRGWILEPSGYHAVEWTVI